MTIPNPSCVASRWLSSRTAGLPTPAPLPEEVIDVIRKYREKATRGVCPVTPRAYRMFEEFHPLAGACRGLSVGLAYEIDRVLGRRAARVVGGWYRKADPDYYYPSDYPSDSPTYPPEGLRREGERWREHWWVELDGHYIDVSADQFFPSDIGKQKAHEVVVVPKTTEVYYPYRRRPLREARPLPPNLEALAAKIASMKQARSWGVRGNEWKLKAWLTTNARKFDVDPDQVADLVAVLRHENTRVDMSRVEDVRDLLREIA